MLPPEAARAVMAVSYAVPCFTMGLRMLRVWRDPMSMDNGRWVGLAVGVFVLEFILLHAGVMIGGAAASASSPAAQLGATLGLGAFYALFAAAIAFGLKSPMLFHSFLWLIGGRLVAALVGISSHDQALLTAHSLLGMALYFPLVVLSILPLWPRLGITETIAAETRPKGTSGLWADQPHRAIGPATVYFLLLGVIELTIMTWVDPAAVTPQ